MTGTPEGNRPATSSSAAALPPPSADPNIGPTLISAEQIAERVAAAHRPDASGLSEWDRLLVAAEHERTS